MTGDRAGSIEIRASRSSSRSVSATRIGDSSGSIANKGDPARNQQNEIALRQRNGRAPIAHEYIARNNNIGKRSSKRCKARPSTSAEISTSKVATIKASVSHVAPTTSKKPAPAPSPASPPASNSNNGGGGKVGLAWPNGNVPELQNFATNAVGW